MKSEEAWDHDPAAQQRRARYGKLPERVRQEDLVEERAATPGKGTGNRYSPEAAWSHYACLALDLGL
ncbi:hypothetical protein [Streptomyces sp. NPDC059398]|uniref:hypothetical protein n=1 Tax=Streptomyces sp. NPDC059398 TaxID=3346820 RepID=UPI0036A90F4B